MKINAEITNYKSLKNSYKKNNKTIFKSKCLIKSLFLTLILLIVFSYISNEYIFENYRNIYYKEFINSKFLNNDTKYRVNITYDNLGTAGFGNILNTYWHFRAFAYWNNYDFNIIDKDENRNLEGIYKIKNKEYIEFIKYLPKNKIDKFNPIFKKLLIKNKIPFDIYPNWQDCKQLTFFNKPMIDIIANETQIALEQYFKNANKNKIDYNITDCDIAIHFRCGDILKKKSNIGYSFMTWEFYQHGIFELLKRNNKTYCLKESNNKNNLWLIAQISENGAHVPIEIESISDCKIIAKSIQHKLMRTYNSYEVNIVNNDIINDFYLMTQVNLICGTSSFCFNGAIANQHRNIFFPIEGPWDIEKTINTNLIPDNYLFVDALKKGWQIGTKEISERKWNTNVEELIYFILTN